MRPSKSVVAPRISNELTENIMSDEITITIDGVELKARPDQRILEVALDAGIYIPHLCYHPDITPHGSCRVCTVKINGRFMAACTTPVENGMEIVNEGDEELDDLRRAMIEMLLVEGNHYCMFCEKSGHCELQALAYRFGILIPRYPYIFPKRDVDASHPNIYLDRNRCIQCGRCERTSHEIDGKHVFGMIERGIETKIGVDSEDNLSGTDLNVDDKAVSVCPVGAILVKDTAFRTPIGKRPYDVNPIGSDIKPKE